MIPPTAAINAISKTTAFTAAATIVHALGLSRYNATPPAIVPVSPINPAANHSTSAPIINIILATGSPTPSAARTNPNGATNATPAPTPITRANTPARDNLSPSRATTRRYSNGSAIARGTYPLTTRCTNSAGTSADAINSTLIFSPCPITAAACNVPPMHPGHHTSVIRSRRGSFPTSF